MKLSVAFITYNRKDELIRAIESCFPLNSDEAEIVIWDNHSDDEHRTALEEYVKGSEFPIRYYYGNENAGVAGGRNSLWKLCKGEYVFFLDDDAVIGKNDCKPDIHIIGNDFFDYMIEYMEKNKNVGACGLNITEPATNNKLNCKYRYINNNGQTVIRSYIGAAHIMRREYFSKDMKLYPSKLMYGSEELFACHGIWDRGYEVHEISDLTVEHMPSKINRHAGKEKDFLFIVTQYIVRLLNYPKAFWGILYIFLRIRLLYHDMKYSDARNMIKERFDKSEIVCISFTTWCKLAKKFKLRNMV